MKLHKFVTWAILIGILGCSPESNVTLKKGSFKIGFTKESLTGGRASADMIPHAILFSVEDAQGNLIYSNELRLLYSFGNDQYLSESIELAPGNYSLVEFVVINEANDVIYLTPMEGSPFVAQFPNLIDDPLPMNFSVQPGEAIVINPQVITFDQSQDPGDFGYASLSFEVVDVPQPNLISLQFIGSFISNMANGKYDSVRVTLSGNGQSFSSLLDYVSPLERGGAIDITAIAGYGTYDLKFQAYYQVLDEVAENAQVNESVFEIPVSISANTQSIRFNNTGLAIFENDNVAFTATPTWQSYAHLYDVTGDFHLILKNEICDSQFTAIIQDPAVDYVYADKIIYSTNLEDYDHQSYGLKVFEQLNPPLFIHNTDAFANFCPDQSGRKTYGEFWFVTGIGAEYKQGYVEWYYESPAINPDGTGAGSGRYVLKNLGGGGRIRTPK